MLRVRGGAGIGWRAMWVGLAIWCGGSVVFGQGFGDALKKASRNLDKAKEAAEVVSSAAGAATVPSGAAEQLRKVDQKLDKMDRMMSAESGNYDKDYRSKEAAACLQEAKDGMATVERRYGSKMGQGHPELVARRDRIAAGEKSVAAFQSGMSAAMQKDADARASQSQSEAAADQARRDQNAQAMADRQAATERARAAAAGGTVGGGKIVFSKSPIDASSPANLTNRFQAGDTIYGLIQAEKSWREIYNAKDRSEVGVMVGMKVGDSDTYQYVTLKKAAYMDSNQLALEIAPSPDKMTAYKDPDMVFGEGKGNRKIGPIAFTYELGRLPAGKHVVRFYVRNYGDNPAVGELEIEGGDFKFYADLHEKVKASSDAVATMPAAQMVNKSMEAQMRSLLENAGWSNILRVVIVDKDWWMVDGGSSRYLNVAAASKGADGVCFWCNLQFTQVRLISGGWGPLELTKTGIKRPIAEENVNK